MIELEQYKETIHRCSKCGLCQAPCPIYKRSGNECDTARGMLIMLKGVINRDIPFDRGVNRYLDNCLRCGLCTLSCPSGISIDELIFAAKCKYLYSAFGGIFTRIRESGFVKKYFKPAVRIKSKYFETKALYLGKNTAGVVKILNNSGIELLNDSELDWGCGYLLSGNLLRFRKNMSMIEKEIITKKPMFIITDIPPDQFRKLIKTYGNIELKPDIKYLADFANGEQFVSRYYNCEYARKFNRFASS